MAREEFSRMRNTNSEYKKVYMSRDTVDDGSAVRKAEVLERPLQERQIKIYTEAEAKVKPRVGRGIDFLSMAILGVAIAATLYICIQYLQIKSDIVQLEKLVAGVESDISAIQKENAAMEASIDAYAYDLEYVYNTAVGKLGMVYPNKNEVYFYNNDDNSYFRQYNAIPQK